MARRDGPIQTSVKNLLGGVSQQPDTVRLENQCEVQDNAFSSVVDGLGKRQPVEHIKRLDQIKVGLTEDEVLVHWIDRDNDEQYAMVIDNALGSIPSTPGIHIYDLSDGTLMNLSGKDGRRPVETTVKDYLEAFPARPIGLLANAKRDLKVLTLSDTTYILNKAVTTKMETGLPPWDSLAVMGRKGPLIQHVGKSARRWFLFQRTANPLSRYAVKVRFKTADEHSSYPGTWDPAQGKWKKGDEEELSLSWVKTFSLDYTRRPNTTPGTTRGYGKPEDIPTYDPANKLHRGYQIPTIQTHEVVKRLFTERNEGSTSSGPLDRYYRGGIQDAYNTFRTNLGERISELIIWDEVIATYNNFPFVSLPQKGPVMMMELLPGALQNVANKKYREAISIEVDSTGDIQDSLVVFSAEVARLSQLPLTCKHGHIVKITGLEDNDSDEYYTKFVANKEEHTSKKFDPRQFGLVEGHWEESLAPMADYRIDNTTMPVKMIRVDDNSPGNTKGFRFEIFHADWTDRRVGDDDSNPLPSFINNTIEDLFLWRNRIGFLTGSRFVMSEADEYQNFWRTTVKTLLDSDPIDIDAGHADVAHLSFATPLEEELIIWTDRTQFVVQGDPILTPKTAGLSPATAFEAFNDVRPEVLDNGIYYALRSGGGDYSQIRQFHRVADASGSFTSLRASEQVPRYIKGKIQEMTATSLESILCTRTDDADGKHVIYVYKWHDTGSGERILSSWFRYLVGPSYGTIVHGMKFYEDDLYLIVQRNTEGEKLPYSLEKITFSGQRQVDTDALFRTLIDRRISDASVDGAGNKLITYDYDSVNKTLDIILPYLVGSDTKSTLETMRIVSRVGTATGPQGEQFAYTHAFGTSGGNRVSVLKVSDPIQALYNRVKAGGTDDFKFYVGSDYTMTYEFSRPSLRRRREGRVSEEISTGRFQLLRAHLTFEDTGYMKVEVAPALHSDGSTIVDRDTRTYLVPMLEVGMGSSYLGVVNVRDGKLTFGIRAQPEHVRIILTNDSPYPCNPKGIDYESNYSSRSRIGAF
jgi:hypothetical protein